MLKHEQNEFLKAFEIVWICLNFKQMVKTKTSEVFKERRRTRRK